MCLGKSGLSPENIGGPTCSTTLRDVVQCWGCGSWVEPLCLESPSEGLVLTLWEKKVSNSFGCQVFSGAVFQTLRLKFSRELREEKERLCLNFDHRSVLVEIFVPRQICSLGFTLFLSKHLVETWS